MRPTISAVAVARVLLVSTAAEITQNGQWMESNDTTMHPRLGSRQLFFDTSQIERSYGISVSMHPVHMPDAAHPVLEPEKKWEGNRFSYYNSLVDNGTHVLLYYDALSNMGAVRDDIQRATCLAISADGGKTFTRPSLGLVKFNGSWDNNIVWPLNNSGHSPGTVFMDHHAPSAERYKMIALWNANSSSGSRDGIPTWAFSSPDGIHFTPIAPVYHQSDTQDAAMYDANIGKYVAFRRFRNTSGRVCHACLDVPEPFNATTCEYQCAGCTCSGFAPARCQTVEDCEPQGSPESCAGQAVRCIKGVCQSNSSDPGSVMCLKQVSGVNCADGDSAWRRVGRCESDRWGAFEGSHPHPSDLSSNQTDGEPLKASHPHPSDLSSNQTDGEPLKALIPIPLTSHQIRQMGSL